ncbi:Wzz/FepE/Etk N-terminal domain-containing protein [Vibrio ostreicida]|uniref:Wzz/FepE/Etk N-terminal domain-containing protein n=1 Tax=Vibrio ostreicida TaxID=526588 RepID=UPI003B59B099
MNKPLTHEREFTRLQPLSVSNDDIDIKELISSLWKEKWTLIAITALFALGGVIFSTSRPNIYKASAVVVAANDEKSSGLAAMASQFGGLASLAGINVAGGKTDDKALSLATLQSRKFINAFVEKYALLPTLMATKSWNEESNEIVLDSKVYDGNRWLQDASHKGKTFEPSAWEAYKKFKSLLNIRESKETGIVTISITHLSPYVAQQWSQWLVFELNSWMKEESITETNRNIEYLEQQLDRTKVVEMQNVFYQIIEEQTKTLMLAEVKEEYAFKTIDPPVVPEETVGPKRVLICVLAALLGVLTGVAFVLVRYAFRREGCTN